MTREFEPLPKLDWYWKRWKLDPEVQAMHLSCRMAYAELLWAQFSEGGSLPDIDIILQRLSTMSPRSWGRNRQRIMSHFAKNKEGRWENKLMRQVFDKATDYQRIQKERSKIRWDPTGKPKQSHGIAVAIPRQSHGNPNTPLFSSTPQTPREKRRAPTAPPGEGAPPSRTFSQDQTPDPFPDELARRMMELTRKGKVIQQATGPTRVAQLRAQVEELEREEAGDEKQEKVFADAIDKASGEGDASTHGALTDEAASDKARAEKVEEDSETNETDEVGNRPDDLDQLPPAADPPTPPDLIETAVAVDAGEGDAEADIFGGDGA